MAKPPIRIRRSAVPGAIPTTGQLALGELAINTFDGKAFLKKDDGVESIVELGSGGGGGAYTAPLALALYEKTNSGVADSFDGTETRFQLRDAGGAIVSITNALYVAISVNGVVQKPNTGTPSSPFEGFYVTANATQGYDIVFDTAPATGADFFGVLAGTFTATSGTSGIKILDDISSQFNGTLTAFTLKYNTANYTPDFPDAVVVSVGGVVQVPTDAYSISGSTITFTSAPPTGASFYALSFEIGTNPDFDVIDSVSSTSTTDAASANAVKTAYDLANAALPKAGGIITGNLEIGNTGSLTFEGSTANAFETTLAVTDPTADRTVTLPDVSGTVVTTGDTGSVTSTMIADGTIVNGDINTSAAIAGTKISPDFGSQNVTTTGTSTAASFIPTSSTVPTNGVYLPAANSVAISTNSTQRLLIDASGNVNIDSNTLYVDATNNRVGIGTNSPSEKLTLSDGNIRLDSTTSTSKIILFHDTAGLRHVIGSDATAGTNEFGLRTEGQIVFGAGSGRGEAVRIDASKRLLVGTSSSSQGTCRLLIQGNANGAGNAGGLFITRGDATPADGVNIGVISFADSGQLSSSNITAKRDGGTWTSGSSQPTRLEFSTCPDNSASPVERVRIASTGALGLSGANYGSSGQVLTSQGSGAAPQWATPSSGAWQYISSVTASGTTLDFTGIDGTYQLYMIQGNDFYPSAAGEAFAMRTSSNNGSSYDSAVSSYSYSRQYQQIETPIGGAGNNNGTQAVGSADKILLPPGNSLQGSGGLPTSQMGGFLTVFLHSPANTSRFKFITGRLTFWQNYDNTYSLVNDGNFVGARLSTSAINAVRFFWESGGSFGGGTFHLYGLKNS